MNFRSAQDEFQDIENRWRVIFAREESLNMREQQIRERERDIRLEMDARRWKQQERRPKTPRKNNNNNNRKDYAQFAVRPETDNNLHLP